MDEIRVTTGGARAALQEAASAAAGEVVRLLALPPRPDRDGRQDPRNLQDAAALLAAASQAMIASLTK